MHVRSKPMWVQGKDRTRIWKGIPLICRIGSRTAEEFPYLDEPLLSVIVLSTLIVYGKTDSSGRIGSKALSARVPCPISRLLGAPILPTSPTEDGGKAY